MILDLILIAVILLSLLFGLKSGLLVMLGRLAMFVLIVAATFLLVGPLTDALASAPFMAPLADKFGDAVLKPLVNSTANIGTAIDGLGLPAAISELMKTKMPALGSTITQSYPQMTQILFKFALSAIIFILMFIIIVVVITLLTKSLTKAADKVAVIGPANRLGGALVGLVGGFVMITVLLLILGLVSPYSDTVANGISESWIASQFYQIDILSYIV